MIDIESEVFGIISTKTREKYPNAYITGEYVPTPPSFPCISVVEEDNQVYKGTRSSEIIENHSQIMYEVTVYSNKTKGKKTEAKVILSLIDDLFARLGFTRIMYSPVANGLDTTIYRVVARYRAIVSKDKVIYRR